MTQETGDPAQALARFFDAAPTGPVGVAVSGGSDSLALMHLMAGAARTSGAFEVDVVTVDHGLRPEAAAEAETVARAAQALGLRHTVLRWSGWDGQGNLPDAARTARYKLMADWARTRGIDRIGLGHTADDQAETLLMRLARGSGAEGLSGMSERRVVHGVTFVRPLLSLRRQTLRDHLTHLGQTWIDDPTNDDVRYDRPRIRRALPDLAAIGLTVEALTTTAANLRAANQALGHYAAQAARDHVRFEAGDVLLSRAVLEILPQEISRRLLMAAIRWITGADYPPRRHGMERLIDALSRGETRTFAGCLATVKRDVIRIAREPAAALGETARLGAVWDARWHIEGPDVPEYHVAALGEAGLRQRPDWRASEMPRTSLLSSPAIWCDDDVIAAPLAGDATEFTIRLIRTEEDYHAALLTH